MTRKAWSHFLFVGLLWGIPYLLMKVAVEELPPVAIVAGRTAIGAAMLIPYAIYQKTFSDALKNYKTIALYAATEMAGPWMLITTAEKKISSGLAGLLIATTPIWATIFTAMKGDKSVLHSKRLLGIVMGFAGMVALIGIDAIKGSLHIPSVAMVIIAAVCYAYAVMRVTAKLPGVSPIAINGLAMAMVSIVYAPFAFALWPEGGVSSQSMNALIALGVFSTGFAFVYFFKVMAEIGPARASLVTYINTAFAVILGILILGEPLTLGVSIGLPIVLYGSYLASRKSKSL